MAQEGWICPQCRKTNAPWVSQCPYIPPYTITSGNLTSGNNSNG